MVKRKIEGGDDNGWTIDRQLYRQIKRKVKSNSAVGLISVDNYNNNPMEDIGAEGRRSIILHMNGTDDPNPGDEPAYTFAMLNVDERENKGIRSFMFRIGMMGSNELLEKCNSIMGEEHNHINPPIINTKYDTWVVHYISETRLSRGEVLNKRDNSMELFNTAVEYAMENR